MTAHHLNLPPVGGDGRGGSLLFLTQSLFVSAISAGGPLLVTRDKMTGEIVSSLDLPAGAIDTPMTYMYEGKQYIAVTVGCEIHELIALALP